MTTKTKYYKYVSTTIFSKFLTVYGKVWIYKLTISKNPLRKYDVLIFDRITRKWSSCFGFNCIPRGFELMSKKEMFLELL